MKYTYQCDGCGNIHVVNNGPASGLCKLCNGDNHTVISIDGDDNGFTFKKTLEDRVIEMVEERYGSGKAMQVADILRGE